jgi:putative transcriptional regulator
MATHHPSLDLLFDYANGSMTEPVALSVATHATLCPACRRQIAAFEALGGEVLDAIEHECVSDATLQALLGRLDEPEPIRASPTLDAATRAIIPAPLQSYIDKGLGSLQWHRVTRAVEEARLPLSVTGFKAALMRIKAGAAVPVHSHRGNEFTVVLAGGYSDDRGRYERGDFARNESDVAHKPVADPDEACLCLVVLDAPLKLSGALGHLVNPFMRI